MTDKPVRYRSDDEDSARWDGFRFRPGDIVISTRSKSGTTWMQMICALLIFQSPELPGPLARISPWLDWLVAPLEQILARLDAQAHRRFIKTHTPLDGIPLNPMATYIVVGRHPLDMAVSLYHQGNNIDRQRVRKLTGRHGPDRAGLPRLPLREWLLRWIDADITPREHLDSLPGALWHASDAWARRTEPGAGHHAPAVLLVHYDDLSADLGEQMRKLAVRLGIEISEALWPSLVGAATFAQMRARAVKTAPDPAGVLKDPLAFFRRGRSGAGRECLTSDEIEHYYTRVARLAPPEVADWLHRGWSGRRGHGTLVGG